MRSLSLPCQSVYYLVGPSPSAIPARNCSQRELRTIHNLPFWQASRQASKRANFAHTTTPTTTTYPIRGTRQPRTYEAEARSVRPSVRLSAMPACLSLSGGTSRGSLGRSKTAKISRHETRDLDGYDDCDAQVDCALRTRREGRGEEGRGGKRYGGTGRI